jgi:hypothetical protein
LTRPIHVFVHCADMDARDKRGHDEQQLAPLSDQRRPNFLGHLAQTRQEAFDHLV